MTPAAVAWRLGATTALAASLLLTTASHAQETAPTRHPVQSDTPETTAAGSRFTLPRSWSLERRGAVLTAAPPEPDARILVVEVGRARDVGDAVARAWALAKDAPGHGVKLIRPAPATQGWDESGGVSYELSPSEALELRAYAFRKGGAWTVMIADAPRAVVEKRGAAVDLLLASLRPAGFKRESFKGRAPHPLDPARVEALKRFVQDSMRELGIPGASMALVEKGRIVFEGGFGVRELGRAAPVDAHTRFLIASNTKGMTTLLLAKLVDAGRLRWDEPVTTVYPPFRLGDDATTRQVLVRHLVCACTGLPRKDLEFIFGTQRDTPASSTFDQLAATRPTSGFGQVYQYNNLMAAAAGYIAGHLVHPELEIGTAYDRAMQELVFTPLGMDDTTFDFGRALGSNHAGPSALDVMTGRPARVDPAFNDAMRPFRPAGGAWSTAHDMILYVQNELAEGRLPDGTRYVSRANLLERRRPNVSTGEDSAYGMGLEADSRWGVTLIHHGGGLAGYRSDFVAIPSAQVGAVLLTNSDEGVPLLAPFMRRLLELLYDGRPEAVTEVTAAAADHQAAAANQRERLVRPVPPDVLATLADRYANPDLGTVTVVRSPRSVRLDFGLWSTEVASRSNPDGATSLWGVSPGTEFEFVVANRGGEKGLVVRDGQHEYRYRAVVAGQGRRTGPAVGEPERRAAQAPSALLPPREPTQTSSTPAAARTAPAAGSAP